MQGHWLGRRKVNGRRGDLILYIQTENSTKQMNGKAGTKILVFIQARRRRRGSRVRLESKEHIAVG